MAMSEEVNPHEAAQALTEIGQRQEQVIDVAVVPSWYWWAIAVIMIVLAAGVESRRPVAIGVSVAVFVVGLVWSTFRLIRRSVALVQPRNDLMRPEGVLAILGFVAVILAAALPTAFALKAAGVAYPATIGIAAGALVLVVGGPLLMRYLRKVMRNSAGSSR
jgi:hypothetical protein